MILCEKCQKKVATVHLTEILNKQKKEIHLCDNCAKDEGIAFKPFLALNDVLSTLAGEEDNPTESEITCEHCGLTYSDFRSHGRLGCSKDYDVFKKQLHPFLEKVHNSLFHCGKVPANTREQVKEAQEAVKLRRSLSEAVEEENYEEAARLRDQIKKLENEIS